MAVVATDQKWQLGTERGGGGGGGGLSLRELPRINATEASNEGEGRIISRYELDHRRRRRRDQNSIIAFLSWALKGGEETGGGRSSPIPQRGK